MAMKVSQLGLRPGDDLGEDGKETINTGNTAALSAKTPYIMAVKSVDSSGNIDIQNYTQGNLYYFEERKTNASGTYTHRLYPAQRKSDNKCGMYDTVTNTFYPMNGTSTTTSAAGPVVDEYWDLT